MRPRSWRSLVAVTPEGNTWRISGNKICSAEVRVLRHERDQVRQCYAAVPGPVPVGIEATQLMHWFLQLMGELTPRTYRCRGPSL